MTPEGLAHAQKALAKCERAFARMQIPDEDVADAWEDFLQAAARLYEKLKGAATGNPASWLWYGKRLDERRDDPLLSYVHHARNIDHHGIVPVASPAKGFLAINKGAGNKTNRLPSISIVGGKITVYPVAGEPPPEILVQSPYINLEGVWDRVQGKPKHPKVFYPAPDTHLGKPIRGNNVVEAARLAFYYFSAMVAEAESLRR